MKDSVPGGNATRVVRLKRGWRVTFKEKECPSGLLEKIEETFLEGVSPDLMEIPSSISSRVFRFSFMGRDYVFKEYLERGALEPLKALIMGVRAERAWKGGNLLLEKGFLTPPMVAWGVRNHKGMPGRNFLVTVFINGACGLARFLEERGGALSSSESRSMKRRVPSVLGGLVGRLHSRGIVHGDLRLGNILIKGWDGDTPLFYLIDNERNACFKKIPMNLIVKNLVQVNMVLAPCVGPAVRMRFFRAYLREFPLMAANKKALAKEVSLITDRRLREKGRGVIRAVKSSSPARVLVLMSRYSGESALLNAMVLGLDPALFDAKVCYLSGFPDGKNSLDGLGRAIYLDCDARLAGSGIKTIFALVRLLKKERPEILHCHRHKPTVYGAVAAKLAGVPHVVSHVHGLNRTRSLGRKITNRFIFGAVDRIIAVSDGVNKDVLRTNTAIPSEKVVTVHNGIDVGRIDAVRSGRTEVRERLGLKKDAMVFGTVGRLALTKGQVYLLEAFSVTLKNLPGSVLLIAGDGPLMGELAKKAEDLGIASSVRFLGHRSDVFEIMRSFDVFVFPSVAEGLPLALLEAMASGVIVVASNVGGIPDVLGNGLYGRLVPPRDALALAAAMADAALLSAEEKRKAAEAARLRVLGEFTKEVMCKALTDVYGELSGSNA